MNTSHACVQTDHGHTGFPAEMAMSKQATDALSPLGYAFSSIGGLATGVGLAFLLWHLV